MRRAVVACVIALGCAPAPELRPAPVPEARVERVDAVAPVTPPSAPSTQQVIYRDRWPGLDAMLLGVDEARGRAYLKLRAPSRYVIDTIDLASGERVDRWEAQPKNAALLAGYDARFLPLASDANVDLARLGSMMAGWSARPSREGSAWPITDASPDGARVIFTRAPTNGSDGDWLFLFDVNAASYTRIDRGTVASYDAKFSPDGSALAWRGCVGRQPCRYQLYVSSAAEAAGGRLPRPIHGVPEPHGPLWSNDAVYVLSAPADGPRCIIKVDPEKRRARPRVCASNLSSFVLDPGGHHLLFAARRREGMSHVSELGWQRLDEDTPAVKRRVPGASDFSLGPGGLALVDQQEGLLALDLAGGDEQPIVLPDDAFAFVPSSHWLADGRVIVLAKSFERDAIALVRIDIAASVQKSTSASGSSSR